MENTSTHSPESGKKGAHHVCQANSPIILGQAPDSPSPYVNQKLVLETKKTGIDDTSQWLCQPGHSNPGPKTPPGGLAVPEVGLGQRPGVVERSGRHRTGSVPGAPGRHTAPGSARPCCSEAFHRWPTADCDTDSKKKRATQRRRQKEARAPGRGSGQMHALQPGKAPSQTAANAVRMGRPRPPGMAPGPRCLGRTRGLVPLLVVPGTGPLCLQDSQTYAWRQPPPPEVANPASGTRGRRSGPRQTRPTSC